MYLHLPKPGGLLLLIIAYSVRVLQRGLGFTWRGRGLSK